MMTRAEALAASAQEFDVCVIGGGATGAGCALDTQLRGLKTILLEANDFASATSSASTKLIHGGIRYLQEAVAHFDVGQIGVVKRALQERVHMLRNAPYLAGTTEFLIPCYSHWQAAYLAIGVKSYDFLAGRANLLPSRRIGRDEAIRRLPGLNPDGLIGAVSYSDGQFDDAGFNLALVRTFTESGGVGVNHARAEAFSCGAAGRLQSVKVCDEISNRAFEVRARVFVNATGPASGVICKMVNPTAKSRLRLSKGAHILLPLDDFRSNDALLIPKTSDGRVVFAIPWMGRLLVGTTDEPVQDAREVYLGREDVSYLLHHLNQYVQRPFRADQIVSGFAGIRPLLATDSRATKSLSRDHKVEVDPQSGLISILGGKWTTYRAMAEDTINAVERSLQRPLTECATRSHPLSGNSSFSAGYFDELTQKYGVSSETARHLAGKFGRNAGRVLELAGGTWELLMPVVDGYSAIRAEIVYAIRNDMAMSIEDILARRIGLQFYSWQRSIEAAPVAAAYLAAEHAWSDKQRSQAEREYKSKVKRMMENAGLGN